MRRSTPRALAWWRARTSTWMPTVSQKVVGIRSAMTIAVSERSAVDSLRPTCSALP